MRFYNAFLISLFLLVSAALDRTYGQVKFSCRSSETSPTDPYMCSVYSCLTYFIIAQANKHMRRPHHCAIP